MIDAKDKRGCSAYLLACAGGYVPAAEMLLNAGASITACDKRKRNALMLVCRSPLWFNVSMVVILC
jgi:ankyrin repeat protein